MPKEKQSSLDRRIEELRNVADSALRRVVTRQADAMTRYGKELSKFGRGEEEAQGLAGSLLKIAVDEGGRYAEEVYRAGLDYYKAMAAFYGQPSATAEEEVAPAGKGAVRRHRSARGPSKAPAKRQRSSRARTRA